MTRSKAGALVATLFFTVTFFSLGEAAFEGHVNYPAWLLIGDGSFRAYHRAVSARIGVLLVPIAASTVLNVLLLWWRPPSIPRWSVWATLALQLVAWASSALVQIPIQVQLSNEGFSRALIERLIWTDLAFRKAPGYLRLALTGWMLYRVAAERVAAEPLRG